MYLLYAINGSVRGRGERSLSGRPALRTGAQNSIWCVGVVPFRRLSAVCVRAIIRWSSAMRTLVTHARAPMLRVLEPETGVRSSASQCGTVTLTSVSYFLCDCALWRERTYAV